MKDGKLGVARENTVHITQLFLSLQFRSDADLPEFFHFENQHELPSCSDHCLPRSGTKSHSHKCLDAPSTTSDCVCHSKLLLRDIQLSYTHIGTSHSFSHLQKCCPHVFVPFLKSQWTILWNVLIRCGILTRNIAWMHKLSCVVGLIHKHILVKLETHKSRRKTDSSIIPLGSNSTFCYISQLTGTVTPSARVYF